MTEIEVLLDKIGFTEKKIEKQKHILERIQKTKEKYESNVEKYKKAINELRNKE